MSLSRACVVCAVLLAAAQAQEVGSLAGTVVDPLGAGVWGADLRLRGINGEVAWIEGGKGEFRFPNLRPGEYSIEARVPGFATTTVEAIKVARDTETTVKVVMKLDLPNCDQGPRTKQDPIESASSEIAGTVEVLRPRPVENGLGWEPAENVLIAATGPMLLTETGPKSGGLAASTRTDKEGHFKLAIQEPGRYTITAHRDGYTDFIAEDIVVRKGQRTVIERTIPLNLCPAADRCAPNREFLTVPCM
jgi:hypothetical protein